MEHLPAHEHLLEFLFQEYEDETDILLEELKIFSEYFPWDENVLMYCKLLVKKGEDDDLEDSFDSNEENLSSASERLQRNSEVFEIAVKYLDYEINKNNKLCWDLLADSLKILHSNHKEVDSLCISFGDRGGWWVDQNFKDLELCDTNVLVKKGMVAAYLYGPVNEKYLQIFDILERRNLSFPSSSLANLLKEIGSSAQAVSSPCLKQFQPDISAGAAGDRMWNSDRMWNKREWKKIEHIEKFVKFKNDKSFYGKNKK